MKKMLALLLALLMLLTLFACGKKDIGLPVYNGIKYEQEDENVYIIPGIVGSDFDAYIDLLHENGFAYTPSDSIPSEEEAMAMDLWQGAKDDLHIAVFLSLTFSSGQPEQYLKVYIFE